MGGDVAQLIERRPVTPLTQLRVPGVARDLLPRVNFQCGLSFDVPTTPCAIACINIYAHVKDSLDNVRVGWIMATQTYLASTIATK